MRSELSGERKGRKRGKGKEQRNKKVQICIWREAQVLTW